MSDCMHCGSFVDGYIGENRKTVAIGRLLVGSLYKSKLGTRIIAVL